MSAVSRPAAEDAPVLPRVLLPALISGAVLVLGLLLAHAAGPWFNLPVQRPCASTANSPTCSRCRWRRRPASPRAPCCSTWTWKRCAAASRACPGWRARGWVGPGRTASSCGCGSASRWRAGTTMAWWTARASPSTPPPADLKDGVADGLPRLAGPPDRAAEVLAAYRGLVKALAGSDFRARRPQAGRARRLDLAHRRRRRAAPGRGRSHRQGSA